MCIQVPQLSQQTADSWYNGDFEKGNMACAYCLSLEKNKTCYSRSININWIYYNLLSSKAHYSVLLTTEMYKGQTEHVSHVQHFALLFKSIRASIKAKTKNTWRLKTFRSIETNWNIFLTNLQQKMPSPPQPPHRFSTKKQKRKKKKGERLTLRACKT